jgi:hypothetical protein
VRGHKLMPEPLPPLPRPAQTCILLPSLPLRITALEAIKSWTEKFARGTIACQVLVAQAIPEECGCAEIQDREGAAFRNVLYTQNTFENSHDVQTRSQYSVKMLLSWIIGVEGRSVS